MQTKESAFNEVDFESFCTQLQNDSYRFFIVVCMKVQNEFEFAKSWFNLDRDLAIYYLIRLIHCMKNYDPTMQIFKSNEKILLITCKIYATLMALQSSSRMDIFKDAMKLRIPLCHYIARVCEKKDVKRDLLKAGSLYGCLICAAEYQKYQV